MNGILLGFTVVGVAILTGYLIGRIDLLGPHAPHVLSRLTFFVLSPFLLFVVLSTADVGVLFSSLLPASLLAAAIVFILHAAVVRIVWRRPLGDIVIGALSAGMVNSNNIGIPISLYLLGDAAFAAPIILIQLLIFMPIALALLDRAASGPANVAKLMLRTLRNPMIIASAFGAGISLLGIDLPPIVLEPLSLVAGACVPVLLISFGMSLHGRRVLTTRGNRGDVLVATVLKLLVMPLVAWAVAQYLFGLSPAGVLAVVVLASLPTAQNVFNYAQRYSLGEPIARDAIFLTTVGCIPVLVAVALLLG